MSIRIGNTIYDVYNGTKLIEKCNTAGGIGYSAYGENIPVVLIAPPEGTVLFDSLENGVYRTGNFAVKIPVKGVYKLDICTSGITPINVGNSTNPTPLYNTNQSLWRAGGFSGFYKSMEIILPAGDYELYVPIVQEYDGCGCLGGRDSYYGTCYMYAPNVDDPATLSLNGEVIYSLNNNITQKESNFYHCAILGDKAQVNTLVSPYKYVSGSGTSQVIKYPTCIVPPMYHGYSGSFNMKSRVASHNNTGIETTSLEIRRILMEKYNDPYIGDSQYGSYERRDCVMGGLSPITNTETGPGAGGNGYDSINATYYPGKNQCSKGTGGYIKITYLGKN